MHTSMNSKLGRRTYRGFTVHIIPRGRRFGYRLRSEIGADIDSPRSFASEKEAYAAACRFVDAVDTRCGLGSVAD